MELEGQGKASGTSTMRRLLVEDDRDVVLDDVVDYPPKIDPPFPSTVTVEPLSLSDLLQDTHGVRMDPSRGLNPLLTQELPFLFHGNILTKFVDKRKRRGHN